MKKITNNHNEIFEKEEKNLYMIFNCTNAHYAVKINNVVEVMKIPTLEHPQKLPNNAIGLLKYDNIMINIFDIRFYLDIPVEKYDIFTKLIVLKTDESIFGIVAEDIDNIVNIPKSSFQKIPFTEENNLIDSLYKLENESINILNVYTMEDLLKTKTHENKIEVKQLFPKDKYSIQKFDERTNYLREKNDVTDLQNIYSKDQFLSFRLNENTYCLNLNYVKEVAKNAKLIGLPCAPNYIEGLISMRGTFITIINFKNFLNLKNQNYKKKNKMIIVNSEEFKMGFLVDEIYDIFDITEEELYKNHFMNETPYVFNEIIKNDKILIILDMVEVLSSDKMFIEED